MSKGLKFQRRISILTAFAAFNVLWCELETWVEYENTKPVEKLPREMIFWEIYGWEQNILLLRHSAWLRQFEKHTSYAIVFQQTEKQETGDTVNKILKINAFSNFPHPVCIFTLLILCLVKFHRPQSFNPVPDKPSTLKLSHLKDFAPYQAATRFRHVFLLLSNICTISALPRLLWCVFTTRLILSKNNLFDTSMQTEKFSHISTLHNSTAHLAWFWTAVGCHGKLLHCMVIWNGLRA